MTVTSNLTLINNCDIDNWNGDSTVDIDEDFMKEGVACMGLDCDIEINTAYYDLPADIDFTGCHLFLWVMSLTPVLLDTAANGGIRFGAKDNGGTIGVLDSSSFVVSENVSGGLSSATGVVASIPDGTSLVLVDTTGVWQSGEGITGDQAGSSTTSSKLTDNIGWWYLGGSDTYGGGWSSFSFSAEATYNYIESGNAPVISKIERIYVGFKALSKSKLSQNSFWDYVRYQPAAELAAIKVTDGTTETPLTWEDIYTSDDSADIGAVTKSKGVYYINGPIQLGDNSGTDDCYFEDTGQIVLFSDAPVSGTFYRIIIEGNSTGTTSFKLGSKSGGRGIQGCVIKALNSSASFQIHATSSYVDALGLYGTSFLDANTILLPTSASNREIIDCSFVECAEVLASTCWLQHSFFISPDDRGVRIVTSSHNVRDSNFINCPHGINFPNSGTYDLLGLNFSNCTKDIENSSFSGSLTINNLVGSNAQTSDNTNGGTTTINTQRTLTLSGLQSNSEVRILDSSRNEIEGTESSGTSYQYNYNYVGAVTIYIAILHINYTHIYMEYILTDSNQTIPIEQKSDRVYSNP